MLRCPGLRCRGVGFPQWRFYYEGPAAVDAGSLVARGIMNFGLGAVFATQLLSSCSAVFRLLQRSFWQKWRPHFRKANVAVQLLQGNIPKIAAQLLCFACGMLQGRGFRGVGFRTCWAAFRMDSLKRNHSGPLNPLNAILSLLHPLNRERTTSAIGSAIGSPCLDLSRITPQVGVLNRLILNHSGGSTTR